ncbi:MAG: hypothetical protein IPI54_01700 [Chitinophagaceae bacterium]|nr:hypothetical protein [Chitinophagaceae bacterium]
MKFKGLIIRSIETIRLGFEYDIDDTTSIKNNFGTRVGKRFTKTQPTRSLSAIFFLMKGIHYILTCLLITKGT